MSGKLDTCLFIIIPELYHPHYGYELSTIWQGVRGVHGTNYFCGHDLDLAIEFCNELNRENGYEPDYTTRVLERAWGLDKIDYFRA